MGNGEQCQRYHRRSPCVCCPASHPKQGGSRPSCCPAKAGPARLTWTLAWSLQSLPFLLHHRLHAPLSLV